MIMNDLQTFILEFQKRKASSFLASLSQAKQSKQNSKEDNSTQSTSKSDASEEPVTIHPVRHSCGKYWETIWAGILVVSTEKQYEQTFVYTKYFQNDGIKTKHKLSISKILCILCIWLELSKLCNIWRHSVKVWCNNTLGILMRNILIPLLLIYLILNLFLWNEVFVAHLY